MLITFRICNDFDIKYIHFKCIFITSYYKYLIFKKNVYLTKFFFIFNVISDNILINVEILLNLLNKSI